MKHLVSEQIDRLIASRPDADGDVRVPAKWLGILIRAHERDRGRSLADDRRKTPRVRLRRA